MIIVFKTNRLFRLSMHTGIRYFRNAFFFFGIGFFIRYLIGSPVLTNTFYPDLSQIISAVFEFFLVIGGFFLLYSLLWKKIERGEEHVSSLLNSKVALFYMMSVIIIMADFIWNTFLFMFLSQILIFLFASIISYSNLQKKEKKYGFPKFYFLAMVLGLIAWTLNALVALYFEWNQIIIASVYIFNMVFFFLFLFGVLKIIKH